MPALNLQSVTTSRKYLATPGEAREATREATPEAVKRHVRRRATAPKTERQAALLGAAPKRLPAPARSSAEVASNLHDRAKRQAQAAKVARVALGLRALAVAAERLRAIPGGGAAADTLLRSLDAMVNRGGKLYADANKLKRTAPPPQVGWAFLVSIAPWALRGVGAAVTAARVGLSRFGPGLVANARTAASFVAGKVGPLLAKAKNIPGVATVAALAVKAFKVAGLALGIGSAAAALTPGGRSKLKEGGRRAFKAVKEGRPGAALAEGAAGVVDGAATSAATVAPKWLPWAAGALLAAKVLL